MGGVGEPLAGRVWRGMSRALRRDRPSPPSSPDPAPSPAPAADLCRVAEGDFAIFRLLYGRPPGDAEVEVLRGVQSLGLTDPAACARHVLARFDRQVLASPVTVRLSEADLAYATVHGFRMALDRADVSIGRPLLEYGAYEPHMTRFYRRHIRPGMTVVDVGANVGYHTLLASSLVGESGRVLAFEPNTENCRLILLSLHANGIRNVELHPLGLSDRAGPAYYTPHLGSNGGLLPGVESTLRNPNCVVIPTARLDDVVGEARVDLIKVDTEGAEGLVMRGARRILERDRPILSTEFSTEMLPWVSRVSPRDYLEGFRALGYRTFRIDRRADDLEPVDDLDGFLDGIPLGQIEDLAFFPTSGPNARG